MPEPILPLLLLSGLAMLFGAIIGSFLNVVIHRIPRGESIVSPGSRCPSCGASIRPIDNIPLLSFVLRRRRCRECHALISWRYPMVELLTGIVFAAIVWNHGVTPESLLEMIFVSALISLVFIDAQTRTLPNVITYPLLLFSLLASAWRGGWGEPIGYDFDLSLILNAGDVVEPGLHLTRLAIRGGLLIALAAPSLWLLDRIDLLLFGKYIEIGELNEEPVETEEMKQEMVAAERRYERTILATVICGLFAGSGWIFIALRDGRTDLIALSGAADGLKLAVIGALVGAIPVWFIRTIYFYLRGVEGMGLGDIKLLASIGAFLGWQGVMSVLLLGSVGGSLVGILLMRQSGGSLRTAIPFGCFLGLAAMIVLFRNVI